MTKLLDEAIAKVRELPDAEQDDTAEMLLWVIEARSGAMSLDEETAKAIEEGVADARRGDFASEEEVAALWRRQGL
jgi:predicted transcriptional regulator